MANLLRAGYNQNQAGFFCDHAGFDALLGIDSFGNGRDINIPYFFNGNSFGCYDLGDSNAQARLSSTLMFADTFTMVKGAHTVKFGGEYRSVKDTSYDNFSSRDLLSLNDYSTYGPTALSYNFAGDPTLPPFAPLRTWSGVPKVPLPTRPKTNSSRPVELAAQTTPRASASTSGTSLRRILGRSTLTSPRSWGSVTPSMAYRMRRTATSPTSMAMLRLLCRRRLHLYAGGSGNGQAAL